MSGDFANEHVLGGLPDDFVERFRAHRYNAAGYTPAADFKVESGVARTSRHWPLWAGFLRQLRDAVEPITLPGRSEPRMKPGHKEAASALLHMASGEFWGDETANMAPVDLAAAKKAAGEYVVRYGLEVPETAAAPGPDEEITRLVDMTSFEKTRDLSGYGLGPNAVHGPASGAGFEETTVAVARAGETTREIKPPQGDPTTVIPWNVLLQHRPQ